MERRCYDDIAVWAQRPDRRPLIVRGARQVGKTHLIKELGRRRFRNTVLLDFERDPEHKALFLGHSPQQAIDAIALLLRASIVPGETLLFLDEIQAAPEVFARLRYFYEELPQLHVVAAGSLLDFALREQRFSVPVGRVEYLYLEPLTFSEFLLAAGEGQLLEHLRAFTLDDVTAAPVHARALELHRLFAAVGGMPAAVARYVETGRLTEVTALHANLLASMRDDFSKYGTRAEQERLRLVLRAVPPLVGRKFVYSQVEPGQDHRQIKTALELLTSARVVSKVWHTHARGVPLGAERDDRRFKVIHLDSGLMLAASGLNLAEVAAARDLALVNDGALAEQTVGQALRAARPSYLEPELYYWVREGKGGNAEVDYVVQRDGRVVPIECKAGRTGRLRSLHLFVAERSLNLGVRINGDAASVCQVDAPLHDGSSARYRLLSLPFYLVDELGRLVDGLARR